MEKGRPTLEAELCTRCGLCVEACPCGSVEVDQSGLAFHCPEVCVHNERCDCGCLCEEVCPTWAIQCTYEIVSDSRDQQTGGEDKGK
jgi:formate hydrogenlyase subunit 6/NADH:ubiquinone oxidoreductase subunit I